MSRLIGLVGPSSSGKDEVGRFLSDEHRFVRVAFADALKEGAMVLMGLSRDQLWGDRRNERDERWGQTPRELYQRLGDALRSIHPDALILAPLDKCRGLLGEGRSVVVTDVRMQREADRIRELGGVLWRVRRHRVPSFAGVGHATEIEAERIEADRVLDNVGTIDDLRLAAARLLPERASG